MLTPEQIAALTDKAEGLCSGINDFLLNDICRRIAGAGQLTSTAAYQVYKLQTLGIGRSEIEHEIQKRLNASRDEVKVLLTQSAQVGYDFDIAKLPRAAVPFAQNTSLQQIVNGVVQQAADNFTNITQTLGMVDPFGKAKPLQEVYQSCMDFAFNQVSVGGVDYNTAVRNATRQLAARGVRVIDYESGVHTGLEAAVRRNILGGAGLLQEEISRYNHDTLGANGWEISAHLGCAPDHEPVQGRQYSDEQYTRLNGSLKRRIGTLNCGHSAFPIIMGVNEPQYTSEQLEEFKKQNATGVVYGGKHYTLYGASQQQRQVERAIRRQKNHIIAAGATGDKDKLLTSQIRLTRLNQEYTRFSKATGLKTQKERAAVAGFGRGQAQSAKTTMKAVEKQANAWYNYNNTNDNVAAYLRDVPVINILQEHGATIVQRADDDEFIIDIGKVRISELSNHAIKNQYEKLDRVSMTQEAAQGFVDNAKIMVYQSDKDTIKFLAVNGYTVLNWDNKLITAVPQKWRKKYDKYLK